MAQHITTGKYGEQIAVNYLLSIGYKVLATNWRNGHLETDIIAKDGNILVFVEVKTRKNSMFGMPEEGVSAKKQQQLMACADAYLDQNHHQGEIRFDVIAILLKKENYELNHIKDAFFGINY